MWTITPILIYFRAVGGYVADFGALGKMLITLERNMPASSAFCKSTENNFFYRMVRLDVKTKRVMFLQYSPQHVDQSNLTQFYAPKIFLSNGENRRSLSYSYQKLFKKWPLLLYFEMDNSFAAMWRREQIYRKSSRMFALLNMTWEKSCGRKCMEQ